METTIFLVRHSECQGNIENKLSGITDFKITKISSFLCFVKKLNVESCNKLKQQENTSYSILKYKNEKFYLIEEATSEHLKGLVL